MRLRTLRRLFWMGIGGALVALVVDRDRHTRARAGVRVRPGRGREAVPSDPEVEAAIAFDEASAELDSPELTSLDALDRAQHDVGELYGAHVTPALDTSHPDGDASFDQGQNWLEALETDAAEFGPAEERELDMSDEQDVPPHASDTRDTPVADRGAGGPAGL